MHFGAVILWQSGVQNQRAGCRASLGYDMKSHNICGDRLHVNFYVGVASVRKRYFARVGKNRSDRTSVKVSNDAASQAKS
jgi:hypothetical protein